MRTTSWTLVNDTGHVGIRTTGVSLAAFFFFVTHAHAHAHGYTRFLSFSLFLFLPFFLLAIEELNLMPRKWRPRHNGS